MQTVCLPGFVKPDNGEGHMNAHRIESAEALPMTAKAFQKILAGLVFAFALLASTYLHAQQNYDPRLVAMLPTYCKYTQPFRVSIPENNIPEEVDRWTQLTGGMLMHLHHYCWGLMDTNIALLFAKTPQERMMYLKLSIGEFDYVIRYATPEFALLPEILSKKGENLMRLGRAPLAIPVLERAIEVKGDYWPPYASLSDYYKEAGDLAKARQWLEKGLSASPNAKALQRRLAELRKGDGKRASYAPRLQRPQALSAEKASAQEQSQSSER